MNVIDKIVKVEDEKLATYCQRRNLTELKAFNAPATFVLRKVSYESGRVYWTLYTDEEKQHVLCSDGYYSHVSYISSHFLKEKDYKISSFMQVIAMYDKYVEYAVRNPFMENRNFQVCSTHADEIYKMYSRDDELKFLVGRKIDKVYIA